MSAMKEVFYDIEAAKFTIAELKKRVAELEDELYLAHEALRREMPDQK